MAAGNGKNMRASALEASFGKTPVVPFPTTGSSQIFLSLHTGNPGDDGQTSNEVTGTGYLRLQADGADWAAAVVGANDAAVTISNGVAKVFGPSGAAWSSSTPITFIAAWKTSTGTLAANFLGRVPITPSQTVTAAAQSVTFAIGAITFSDNSS